ncbi:MAG: hypothetical protein ACE5OZ_02900 [Candidatus Heimdallarchaeota archaeon]
MSEGLLHHSNGKKAVLLEFLPLLILIAAFFLSFTARDLIGRVIPGAEFLLQIASLIALLTLPGYIITKLIAPWFLEDFNFSESFMLWIIFSMLLWMFLALLFAIFVRIDSLSIFLTVCLALVVLTISSSRTSKPLSKLKGINLQKLTDFQFQDILRLPELSLIIPVLIGLISSLIYFLGPSQWDPLFYAWRIERFTKLEDIDFAILAISQAEGFYALFVFLDLSTGLTAKFWLQWSALPFSFLTGVLILNIGRKLTDEPIAIWFLMIFVFLVAFSHTFIINHFWASVLAGIYFLFGLWVYLNADRFNNYLAAFLLLLSCLAAAVSHVFMGLLLSLVLYSTLLFSKPKILSQQNAPRTLSILLSLIIAVLRVSFNTTQGYSAYESYMQKYLNVWGIGLFILLSFLGRYVYLSLLNEQNFSLPVSAFFWLMIISLALSALVLIPLVLFEDEFVKSTSFLIHDKFSFKPMILKAPLLLILLVGALLTLVWIFIALSAPTQSNKEQLLFSLSMTTFLTVTFLIWAYTSGFFPVFYAFRILPYMAIAIAFVMVIIITDFLHDQNFRYFAYFVVILSLILSPSALTISLPLESDRQIDQAEYKLTGWAVDHLPYGSAVIVPHLRLYGMLEYHNEGNLANYPYGRLYIFIVYNLTDLAEDGNFTTYGVSDWENQEYVYFLFNSNYDEVDLFSLTQLGLEIVKTIETNLLLQLRIEL